MNQTSSPKRPRPTKSQNKRKPAAKTSLVDWLTDHWTLAVVIGLAILVIVVFVAASLGTKSGDQAAEPEPRPDSSGPIQIGDLQVDVHQWDCGLPAFESLENSDEIIAAAEDSHFCTLGVKVANLNLEKSRAFDPAGQLVRFDGQDYGFHINATRNGLGADAGVRILSGGTGINPGSIAPLVNMVFELPQNQDGDESPSWQEDAMLLVPDKGSLEGFFKVNLLNYDKQS